MSLKSQIAVAENTVAYSPNVVFFCPEESQFYAQCIEKMVLNQCFEQEEVIEFGAGEGSPVISSLLKTPFTGTIHGYELNPVSSKLAQERINQYNLASKYKIHNTCFFEGFRKSQATYLIANPPYLPAMDNDICMPALHGGTDGAGITMKLLSMGCENVLLMISAYSNPVETIEYAQKQGYQVVDFMISPLQFGYYSSEPKVRQRIHELKQEGKAFYSENIYFLAGVLFKKQSPYNVDLSSELIKVMMAL